LSQSWASHFHSYVDWETAEKCLMHSSYLLLGSQLGSHLVWCHQKSARYAVSSLKSSIKPTQGTHRAKDRGLDIASPLPFSTLMVKMFQSPA
jgi:hypothetical protein